MSPHQVTRKKLVALGYGHEINTRNDRGGKLNSVDHCIVDHDTSRYRTDIDNCRHPEENHCNENWVRGESVVLANINHRDIDR